VRKILVFLAAGLISACGTSEYDWQRAYAANTLSAYQNFLKDHPKSKQADLARGVILAMQDDQAWKAAALAQSKQGFDAYLAAYPGGVHADQARFDITALDRAAAWKLVEHDVDYASLHAFLAQYPTGPESDAARARMAKMTFRAKFADAASRGAADRQRARLQLRLHDILNTLEIIPPSQADKHYEVASGLLSDAAAHAACVAALHEHQRCEVVSDAGATHS
jgi:outer membrane protein assembly factor BamD (BamD/ComL family)